MLTCFINTFHLDSVFYLKRGWEGGTPSNIRFVFQEFGIFLLYIMYFLQKVDVRPVGVLNNAFERENLRKTLLRLVDLNQS